MSLEQNVGRDDFWYLNTVKGAKGMKIVTHFTILLKCRSGGQGSGAAMYELVHVSVVYSYMPGRVPIDGTVWAAEMAYNLCSFRTPGSSLVCCFTRTKRGFLTKRRCSTCMGPSIPFRQDCYHPIFIQGSHIVN